MAAGATSSGKKMSANSAGKWRGRGSRGRGRGWGGGVAGGEVEKEWLPPRQQRELLAAGAR